MFSTADGFDRHDPILQHDPVWREMCEWIEATLGQKNDDVWGELYVGGRYCFTFTDPKFITILKLRFDRLTVTTNRNDNTTRFV